METATLTSPLRPVMVQPIQKSLSLPSYARASGEGIDHKIIFAALEQREKVRRKSKIFKDKEKSGATRQNYFCLPLPTGKKCRETSLSSDTSCSSLEFQKPKLSPTKATKIPELEQNGLKANDDSKPTLESNVKIDVNNNSDEGNCDLPEVPIEKDKKERTVRGDTSRSTIGSSDSMERTEKSSKSSNDSLSRKERLVAIKARVEAEREKNLCGSSSDEEEVILRITRHNSDGVIHRTVREVKSKSSRAERRFKRRVPEESAARRNARKQHRSLYIPSTTDFDSSKPPIMRSGSSFSLQKDLENLTKDFLDFSDKPKKFQFQLASKDQYFSDICSGSYRSRFVKTAVEEFAAKEQKQRLNKDSVMNRTAGGARNLRTTISPSEMLFDSSSHSNFSSMEHKHSKPLANQLQSNCASPAFRAPTPPPRSPKSIEFVNQVILQHQNASSPHIYNDACSLERKKPFRYNTPASSDTVQSISFDTIEKDLMNSKRQTCISSAQDDSQNTKGTNCQPQSKLQSQHFPPRSPDFSQKLLSSTRKMRLSDMQSTKILQTAIDPGKRWEKREVDSEKAFNSLESKNGNNEGKWKELRLFPKRKHYPLCSCLSRSSCDCKCKEFSTHTLCDEAKAVSGNEDCALSKVIAERMNKPIINTLRKCNIGLPSPESRRRHLERLYGIESDINADMIFVNRKEANDSLSTAMEELESAYRSLRVSNENLTDRCAQTSSKPCHSDDRNNYLLNGPSIVRKSNPKDRDEYFHSENKPSALSPNFKKSEIQVNSKGHSIHDALCIDELFGDLTEQLDLEQKLLEQMRHKKSPGPHVETSGATTPSEPLNIQKELDNIEKSCATVAKNLSDHESREVSAIASIKQRFLEKKKHKAVRSLSANIATVMQSDNLGASRQNTRDQEKPKENRYPPSINLGDNNSEGQTGNLNNSPIKTKQPLEEGIAPLDRDEIWQIRVSMDPGSGPVNSPRAPESSTFSRLHSVLRKQSENTALRDDAVQTSKQQQQQHREAVRLSENELERLLTTLLRDVSNKPLSEKKNPSLPTNESIENESTIFTKGEMLVMKHLDVIRNCDPS